jgi:hypothetical protein
MVPPDAYTLAPMTWRPGMDIPTFPGERYEEVEPGFWTWTGGRSIVGDMSKRLQDHLDQAEDNERLAGKYSRAAYRSIIAGDDPKLIRAKCDMAVKAFKQVLTDRKVTRILES